MTDANEMYDSNMNYLVSCDTDDDTKEEQDNFSLYEEAEIQDADYVPPSLLSYFETSKNRAAVCEKLLLEETEDFTASHHTENLIKLPVQLNKDMMKVNQQVICEAENEDNRSIDTRLLPAPTEAATLFTHSVSVSHNSEDKAGTNTYIQSAKHLTVEMKTLEISLNEEKRKKSIKFEAEQEKRHSEEMKREERQRLIETDFQEEQRKIIEAEQLHQKELELMERTAQEKLEQEFLLQQELISNLKQRVEEERRMIEEEQKRIKDEEDKRKREEEKNKIEAERKRMKEETRRRKEEERKAKEAKLEEKKKKIEVEEKKKRKREEERKRIDLEKKELEDKMRMMKEEEERKMKEEVKRMKKEEQERAKKQEERTKIETARMEMEKEKRITENAMRSKKEDEEEKRKKRKEVHMRTEEVERVTAEMKERKKQEELGKRMKEEEETDERKETAQQEMYEEMRKRDKEAHGNVDEGIKLEEKRNNEEGDRKTREEEKKEEARTMENEGKKMEEKDMKEVVRKQEKENKKMKEELRSIKEDEERKKEDGRKTKEEEQRRRQKEDWGRQRDEEDSKKSEEERFKEDNECYKIYDIDEGTMEHESKTEDKDKKQREEGKNVEAEKEQSVEEVREKKREVDKKVEEDIKLEEKEESKNRIAQDTEMEVIRIRAAEVQEKKDTRENSKINSKIDQKEKKNTDKTENSSQREDRSTWISNPVPLQSTICPTRPEAEPRHHDQDKSISQTSTVQTAACENQAARLSTEFLPEHTEQKRLSWMKDCVSWSKLSLQNRRKQKGSVWSRRGQRRPADACSLPPLCMDSVLRATGWKSLQEVTTVTLQDLPGCSLSTLAQCTRLQSLSLRRCGLRSLEGINQLPQLRHVDVQENDITFIDCENMTSLRILRLGHNKLTSIHGLTGAENVDVLDLSHNFITRIAGLESVRSLQRLSVDHNQLISTRGLRDVYTLVHLNCSHNHLASVEGLENSALLNMLDLRANSLTEPPSLSNQVLLRELYLDDNCISSLQGLAACWLPLMQHLSVAQNRITQLPSMSNSVSLANLDLRFNCMSELQNVCKSLEGCQSLRELHLTGNPLQQERGWRSTLQKALPGLRAVDNQETDSSLSPPAVQQVSLASGSFPAFCQAQLQQTRDLQQRQSRELSEASSSLDSVQISCRHFKETLQLATEQRFAHEYGDTTVPDKHKAAEQTIPEETLDMDRTNAEKQTECLEIESTGKSPPVSPNRDNIRCRYWTSEEKSAAESRRDTFDNVATRPKTESAVSKAHSGGFHLLETKPKSISCNPEFSQQSLDLQNSAAVVIQQLWRKHRQKCGNISSSSTAEKGGGRGGDGAKPESGPSYINGSVVGQDYAATVIQAFWRGFTLRKRLASALAAVTHTDTREDDTLEEVDMDDFVFDEAALERHWIVPLPADLSPIRYPASEQLQSVKPPGSSPEPPHYKLHPPRVCRSKQAWVTGEEVDSAGQRVSSVSLNRSSPASAVSGLSERSERILEEWGFTNPQTALLMLKRAQNMKSKKQQQKKRRDPYVRLALFQNCSYQLDPEEARNRQAQHNRNDMKVRKVELRLQQAEKTERVKQERARQWLHAQAAHSDRDSESGHFLPEISSDILNGGRVQLVADPGYIQRQHQGSGLWANSRLAARPCTENNYPRRDSLGHAREEVPPPKRVTSAPSKKERISFRDNPVQLSGGWGRGKKRDKVFK